MVLIDETSVLSCTENIKEATSLMIIQNIGDVGTTGVADPLVTRHSRLKICNRVKECKNEFQIEVTSS